MLIIIIITASHRDEKSFHVKFVCKLTIITACESNTTSPIRGDAIFCSFFLSVQSLSCHRYFTPLFTFLSLLLTFLFHICTSRCHRLGLFTFVSLCINYHRHIIFTILINCDSFSLKSTFPFSPHPVLSSNNTLSLPFQLLI